MGGCSVSEPAPAEAGATQRWIIKALHCAAFTQKWVLWSAERAYRFALINASIMNLQDHLHEGPKDRPDGGF